MENKVVGVQLNWLCSATVLVLVPASDLYIVLGSPEGTLAQGYSEDVQPFWIVYVLQ